MKQTNKKEKPVKKKNSPGLSGVIHVVTQPAEERFIGANELKIRSGPAEISGAPLSARPGRGAYQPGGSLGESSLFFLGYSEFVL